MPYHFIKMFIVTLMCVFLWSCNDSEHANLSEQDADKYSEGYLEPFPYTAIIICSPFAFQNMRIPISACMRNEFNETNLRIRSDGDLNVLRGWQTINYPDLIQTDRGTEIALTNEFQIKIQNASDELFLSVEIEDMQGAVIYKEVAEKYDTVGYTKG